MKTKIITLLAILTLSLSAGASETKENNYDDIGNFFTTAATAESPAIRHFYISKAMLRLTAGKCGELLSGFNLNKFIDKIDFIRNVEISANNTKKEKELLATAEQLATKIYKQYNYNNLFATNDGCEHRYLFYKYGEGGLCSMLIISTNKEFDEKTEQASLKQARVILIGGTFRAEDIPTMVNF